MMNIYLAPDLLACQPTNTASVIVTLKRRGLLSVPSDTVVDLANTSSPVGVPVSNNML